jgi:hypothetical protein
MPYHLHSQVPPKNDLRGIAPASRTGVPQVGATEREPDRPSSRGSRAHVDSIPPKYAVSQVVGFIKEKSAIHLARVYGEKQRNFVGQHFWARGYFVSTVGRDQEQIREYIKKQKARGYTFGAVEPVAVSCRL